MYIIVSVFVLTAVVTRKLSKPFQWFYCTRRDLFTCGALIILTATLHHSSGEEGQEEEEEEKEEVFESRKNICLYYNFRQMLNLVYTDEMFRLHQSHFLFIKYEKECVKDDHKLTPNETRKPFIEIECNNNTVRKIILKKMAARLEAIVLDDPAECLEEAERAYEDEDHPLHGVYRTLNLYANAYEATRLWHDKPILVSRYWNEKAAYYINKAYANQSLPVEGSPVYDYPRDMITPDIAFTINYENQTGVCNAYTRRLKEIMFKIRGGPTLYEVEPSLSPDSMIDYMIYKMMQLVSQIFREANMTAAPPTEPPPSS